MRVLKCCTQTATAIGAAYLKRETATTIERVADSLRLTDVVVTELGKSHALTIHSRRKSRMMCVYLLGEQWAEVLSRVVKRELEEMRGYKAITTLVHTTAVCNCSNRAGVVQSLLSILYHEYRDMLINVRKCEMNKQVQGSGRTQSDSCSSSMTVNSPKG